jgi:hypothetical protein
MHKILANAAVLWYFNWLAKDAEKLLEYDSYDFSLILASI